MDCAILVLNTSIYLIVQSLCHVDANSHADGNGDAVTVTAVSVPTNGTATLHPDGTVTYQPFIFFIGSDSFTYTISDGHGGTDTATVSITVGNQAPDAADISISTPGGRSVAVDLLDSATDADGQPVHVVSTSTPLHGAVSLDAAGRATYTPDPGFVGTDSYSYVVSDGQAGSATATVTVVVANSAPTAVHDAATTAAGKPVVVAVLHNDSDPNTPFLGQDLRVTGVTVIRGKGTASITADGRVRVVSTGSYTGLLVVTYTIADASGATVTADVVVTVTGALHLPGRPADNPHGTEASALPHTGADIVPVGILGITLTVIGALACLFATRREENSRRRTVHRRS